MERKQCEKGKSNSCRKRGKEYGKLRKEDSRKGKLDMKVRNG